MKSLFLLGKQDSMYSVKVYEGRGKELGSVLLLTIFEENRSGGFC